MASNRLVPQAFWFRFAVPCPRNDKIPRAGGDGPLLDLPESSTLPDLAELEGGKSWARVRVGWNPRGLGFAVLAEGVSDEQLERGRQEGFAAVELWIDTRDTRDIARATRFCHRFTVDIERGKGREDLEIRAAHRPVARAKAEPPLCRSELIAARAKLNRNGWLLEVFLPAEGLNGFDEETNRRLGFAYRIADFVRDDMYFSVGRDFPVAENPSLWSTLELRD
jgi:hypothetical protein